MEELNLDDIEAVKEKLTELKQQDKWDEVRKIQLRMLEKNPNNFRSLVDLITIAIQNGEKKVAKRYIEKVITLELSDKKAIKYMKAYLKQYAQMAKEDKDWKLLKNIQTRRLELHPKSLSALCDLTIRAKREGDWKRAEELQLRIVELSSDKEKALACLKVIRERLAATQQDEMKEEDFSIENQVSSTQDGISEIRAKLYAGQIGEDEILKIAEEYKNTAQGTVLIAEVCTYLNRQNLAIKALKSYLAEHKGDITDKELKILKGAMEIARSKKRINNSEAWAEKYQMQGEEQGNSEESR